MTSPLVHWLRTLAEEIAGKPPTARSAASLVGGLVDNPGHGLPLVIRPERDGVARATAANRADDDRTLSHVSIELSDDADICVSDLSAQFGRFMRPPLVHHDSPARIIFNRIAAGAAGTVTLIAEVTPATEFDESDVVGATLRFDAAD